MIAFGRSVASKAGDVEKARNQGVDHINTQIGEKRTKFITSIPGQEMIYSAKEAEARKYLSAVPRPADISAYPFMAAEIGVTAPTAEELAVLWTQVADQWKIIGPQLEQLRLGTLNDLKATTTTTGIATIITEFDFIMEFI